MRIEEAVGQRIATLRERKGMSQAQLGEHLGELLGSPWPRQTVSIAEKGGRKLTAAELLSIATILDVSVGQLFIPPAGLDATLEFPSGAQMDSAMLHGPHRTDPLEPRAVLPAMFLEMLPQLIERSERRRGEETATLHELRRMHEKLYNTMAVDPAQEASS